jgi:hypothetical protein
VDSHWSADPYLNPCFDLIVDPDPGAIKMHLDPDPDLGRTLKSQKVEFLHDKYT